jgi:hypothetical protein
VVMSAVNTFEPEWFASYRAQTLRISSASLQSLYHTRKLKNRGEVKKVRTLA